ncbi:hypothetical protein E2C01_032600 [Portunus trituberculatus]|uniref:Uncharacterized protein n=1 Tax=Portunus trituberculatus TaxID=210409 RepID=A0A5B7EVP2_PORTR|nr:hypothetical protein [Portunus trituberculatus]
MTLIIQSGMRLALGGGRDGATVEGCTSTCHAAALHPTPLLPAPASPNSPATRTPRPATEDLIQPLAQTAPPFTLSQPVLVHQCSVRFYPRLFSFPDSCPLKYTP